MEEEGWCMQWSGEVLPEPAMIPDLSVFLCVATAYSQLATVDRRYQGPLSRAREIREALCVETQGRFPGRLRLPFTLSSTERRERSRQISEAFL